METSRHQGRADSESRAFESLGWIDWAKARSWPASWRCPTLQSHRGCRPIGVDENTIEAFRQASRVGYRMVEMDLRLSQDGVAMVFHDENLWRIKGRRDKVRETKASDLVAWGIPRLRDVLVAAEMPEFLNLEIKTDRIMPGRLERAVVDAIRETGAEHRVMFSSFAPLSLLFLQRLLPNAPRAFLLEARHDLLGRGLSWSSVLLEFDLLHVDNRLVTPAFASACARRGIPFSVWTVNDEARARELLQMGAQSIITDALKPWAGLS